MSKVHTFHIPVMGTGFSIDTPVKVAPYGISSVISLVDDVLIEKMREYYCKISKEKYEPITKYEEDHRAKRITAYLNLVKRIVEQKFEALKKSAFEAGSEITKYFELLPESSPLNGLYEQMKATIGTVEKKRLQEQLKKELVAGDINVNIMTKLDRANFSAKDKTPLSSEYSDALSALRGYAQSDLVSSIVFSAGFNRSLYAYIEKFNDFFPDEQGFLKKKVVLKVSDYRSTIIQGKFLAKKGIWVSEYRIESGLNCGGHLFATDGYLMGPILEEFKQKRAELVEELFAIYQKVLREQNRPCPSQPLEVKITAQGGIGTYLEDQFLLQYYGLDGTGWASPFLLVPEVTNVDQETLMKLSRAGEKDIYMSDVSPLGIPFSNLRDNPSDRAKERRSQIGQPGSACPKGYLVSNTEFTKEPICTASRQYQKLKLEQLSKQNLDHESYNVKYQEVVKKACLCNDLGEGVLIKNNAVKDAAKHFPAICPGPNIAYFSKIATLREMVDHIYGRLNLLNSTYRSNMFVKELKIYIDYFIKEFDKIVHAPTEKKLQYFREFQNNMLEGIEYYKELFPKMVEQTEEYRLQAIEEIEELKTRLEDFVEQNLQNIKPVPSPIARNLSYN
ncbi:MAG TPA: hypothetical protein VI749_07485 [Candidatus Omnitrophota bacterium]|nr:hypothetical protein [Candidatus Omnitrophota bacterium]